ncbi:MAG: hypothetical protein AABX38_05990 [Candidatus Micrarchaeota archaeon]
MKNILLILFFVGLTSLIYSQIYDLSLLIYKNDSAKIVDISISDFEPGPFPTSLNNNYHFEIIDTENKIIFNQPFTMRFVVYPDPYEDGTARAQVINLNQTYSFWRLPYFQNAKTIQLYHENKKIWEYNVEYLSNKTSPTFPEKRSGVMGVINNNILLVLSGLCLAFLAILALAFLVYKKVLKK